jgi:hypothetical protein
LSRRRDLQRADEHEGVLAVAVVPGDGSAVFEAVVAVEPAGGVVALADLELGRGGPLALEDAQPPLQQARPDPLPAVVGVDGDVLDVAERAAVVGEVSATT